MRTNVIYQGDNLEIMRSLESGKVDLIYIDPPFCSGSVRKSRAGDKEISFNDHWEGGVSSYIRWLVPRLRECHRLLKDTGVLCLHLDQRSSHYARVELDKIFGYSNLINEVIWHYTNSGGRGKRTWSKKHDVILVYSKTKKYFFEGTRDGQKRQAGKTSTGGKIFEKSGKQYQQIWSNGKSYTYCLSDDKIADDVWVIQPIPPHHPERLGYPTQKPLALLNRIIKCLTNEGNIVADFFCGCGTTVSAAQGLGRKWLGADISPDAIKVIRKRMARDHKLKIEVIQS